MRKIIEFQKDNLLKPDGVIGKKTLLSIKEKLKIQTNEELANFMGQVAHETGGFSADVENLNYSVKGLLTTFKKYFNKTNVDAYAKNPKKIANKVYSNRMGNGDEASNEGWLHRGVGALQLTGKINYVAFSKWLGLDNTLTTEEIAKDYFWETAIFYFNNNKLWSVAKKVDVVSITKLSKAINLGNQNSKVTPNGLDDRIKKTIEFYNILTK